MEIKIRKATAWGKAILKWKDSPSEKKEKKKKQTLNCAESATCLEWEEKK